MSKKIEELANDLAKICPDLVEDCCGEVDCVTHLALSLSKLGYRRQDEVASEIISEIEQAIMAHGTNYALKRLEEIKKKYGVKKQCIQF